MKTTYESFRELADTMCAGDGRLHSFNCPYGKENAPKDDCLSWQHGIRDFAGWLDHIGVKVEVTDHRSFYDYMRDKTTKG